MTPPFQSTLISVDEHTPWRGELNSEVQSELRRTWRGLWPSRPSARDYRLHSSSISRTGSDGALQGPRSSRAPSLLQTETSVI